MDPKRWQIVRQLFDSAMKLEPEQRSRYLEEACGDDGELRSEVLSLLERDEGSNDVVGDAVAQAALSASRSATASLSPGDQLGRYTLVGRLGAGGMGDVYAAEDRELGRKVALKVLAGWMTGDATRLQRFRREARALAALNHPNIVTIHSVEHEEGLHFLTMELVAGRTLDKAIPQGGMSLETFFDVAISLARALAAAHEQGVVHRDLKPANIVLSDNGEVKVLDFGLAKVNRLEIANLGTVIPSTTLTRTGMVMGTFPYMSPEQVEGKLIDERSDIFSLGVVLYKMATGSRPFEGDSSAAVIASILGHEPARVSGMAPHVPPRLGQIVERCLEKDPDKRYQQAGQLERDLEDLRQALERHPKIATGLARLSALVPRARARRSAVITAVVTVLAAVTVVVSLGELARRGRPPPAPEIASLAVLPLANLSGDDEQEFLADGMTEVLITELSKISSLKVISRTSVMRFKNPGRPLPEIAEELGVEAVVEGSVQRSDDRVRVTAQLIHAESDEHLWAESFERDMRDLLTLQGEIARAIAAQVRVTLTPEEQARLASGRSVDPQASEAYLRGRNHWNNFSFMQAAEAYEQAIELDPDFARAWAGLAKTRQMQGTIGFPHPPKVSYPLAKAAVDRALGLDAELAEGHAVRGWNALQFDWNWETAERAFRRTLELSPGDAGGHWGLSFYLAAMGRFEEAIASAESARALDPLSRPSTIWLANILYYARQYDRALFELGERWEEDFAPTHWIHGRLLQARGDPEAAAQAALRDARLNPLMQAQLGTFEEALRTSGASGFWRAMLEFQLAWPDEGIIAVLVAESCTRLGETDKAFEWLDRAYERRDPLAHLGVDPIWDPLRADPRFNDLLIRLKLPQVVDRD